MVGYGKYNVLNFCLIFLVCYCLLSDARFVYRDTVEDLIPTSAVNNDTNLGSNKINNTNNDIKGADRQSKTDKLNAGVSKTATAVKDEQDFRHKEVNQTSSSSTGTERENIGKGNKIQLSRNPEYNKERGQEDTRLQQTKETTLISQPENKVGDVASLGQQVKKYMYTSIPKTDFPRPNGLENDIDDPSDVITHVKPCNPTDDSCVTDQDRPKTDNSLKRAAGYSYRDSRRGTGNVQDGRGSISLRDSNQVLGDERYNKDKKRLTESSADAENDDAYF